MTQAQSSVRPRYGRIAALGSSLTVTVVAVLGGAGVLPSAAAPGDRAPAAMEQVASSDDRSNVERPDRETDARDSGRGGHAGHGGRAGRTARDTPPVTSEGSADASEYRARETLDTAVPARSGTGRRVVFSQNRQRVWLVGAHDVVKRTYLVSGSVTDNLSRGTYEVYSRSEQAYGIDDSGTMQYFVRFTQGDNAAIGFHDIPVKDGHPVQSVRELGTPQSHGCIRQRRTDAIALWEFAPIGTTVVVV